MNVVARPSHRDHSIIQDSCCIGGCKALQCAGVTVGGRCGAGLNSNGATCGKLLLGCLNLKKIISHCVGNHVSSLRITTQGLSGVDYIKCGACVGIIFPC
jgi:hypothetical protein